MRALLAPGTPVNELAGRLSQAGQECYLVGGSVRDALLDVPHDDIDIATDARPERTRELISGWADEVWLQGEAFGTVGCSKSGVRMEITTYRSEVYPSDTRKPTVVFGNDIEADLLRRDFTINSMALRLPDPVLVDPFGGAADLAARKLRTPRSPSDSFLEDPLRMMRAARFIASLSLEPAAELVEAVQTHAGRLSIISAERVRDELFKLLVVADPSLGLWFLVNNGLAAEFFPELPALAVEQDPIHRHKDVLAHTIAVVANTRPELLVRFAALLHDIGKPATREFGSGGVSFHHHEVVGARMARERVKALKVPHALATDAIELVYLHLRFHTYRMGWTDRAVRRYVRDAGPLLDDLNHLVRCDCTTRNMSKAAMLSRRMDELEERIVALRAQEELDSIRPPLDGLQVMEYLGIKPGRVVGDALDFLLELRLDEGPMTTEEAYERLDAWVAQRPNT